MKPSPMRHPLAVLRQILQMSQTQLGELCGNSGRTIQAVELGKLALSEGLALRIAQATGVSVEWLLSGDPKAPAKADCPSGSLSPNAEYTYEVFEAHRAMQEIEKGAAAGHGRQNTFEQFVEHEAYQDSSSKRDAELVERVAGVLERTRGDDQAPVIRWRLKQFLDVLEAQNPVPNPRRHGKKGTPHHVGHA
jgi:transcriptional regulator with XRE-family HTH domain